MNMKTKLLVLFIGLSLLVSFNFAQAQATTTTSDFEALAQTIRQQIEELKEIILQLQGELKQITTDLKEVEKVVEFTQNLHKGLKSKEVERLQEFLSKYPEIYPEGLVTGYFGSLTEKAVKKFQEKYADDVLKPYGLNKGTGFVGEKTLTKINQLTAQEKKITICHYPPDNPENRHTIVINESALETHLAHEDTIGPCEDEPEPEPEPEDLCPNIDGVQETIPEGMFLDDEENCVEPEPGAVLGCTDEAATNYNSEATQGDGSCVYPDTTPPVISNFQPSGTITDLTPTLFLNTDENATCRYVSTTDQSFDAMLSTFSGAGSTYHYVTLGTTTAGTHTYYARCQDTAGNKNTNSASITFTITTTPTPDTTAPVISNIQVSNITQISATITWQTNEESNSVVDYGLSISYGSTVSGETALTYHAVNLTNLTDGTRYHYQVKSVDSAGNQAQGSDRTFTTLAPEPEPSEEICFDSDGPGINILTAGYVKKGSSVYVDTCALAESAGLAYEINEMFCYHENPTRTMRFCPGGTVCKNVNYIADIGKYSASCVAEANITCSETDGGKDYYVKGSSTRYDSSFSEIHRADDMCYGDRILEIWCADDNSLNSHYYTCPNGCSDGACLSADISPPFISNVQEQQLSLIDRLLKDIQSQLAAISTAISWLLGR